MQVAYTGWTWLIMHRDNQKFELEQAIKECKYLGYDVVENFAFIADFYKEDPSELKKLLEKYDVWMANLYGHFGDDIEAAYTKCCEQIDFMGHIGAKFYNCQCGAWQDEPRERPLDKEKVKLYADLSNRLGEYANARGVKFCFHPHAQTLVFTEDQIDYFMENTDPALVNITLDTAHTVLGHMDPVVAFKKYLPRLGYVHFKDVDPNGMNGPRGPMGSFRALGLGTVDFKGVYNVLVEGGYDGVICVELDNPEVCNYNSAEISRKYIKNVLKI